ncbi:MAG: hypothetical protein AAF715_31715 [Myxococcota bacterium]
MARNTTGQKAQRVLRFILGLRRPRVATALAAFGFTQTTFDEGWALLRALVGEQLAAPVSTGPPDPSELERLDAWENKWFVITRATLQRHHPKVADAVFLNLSRTSGPDLLVSVAIFLDRVEGLPTGSTEEQAAHALLQTRGLGPATIGQAREILAGFGSVSTEPSPVIGPAEMAAAEEDMWRWYLEWSSISRIAIRHRRPLRSLGFVTPKRRGDVDDVEDMGEEVEDIVVDDLDEEPAAPVI